MENEIIKKLNTTTTSTSMEETHIRSGIQKQQKFAINLGRGGGGGIGIGIGIGIGVGIILVGGALVANAFQKKQSKKKPTSNNIKKNNSNENTPQEEEDNLFEKEDDQTYDSFHSNLPLGAHSLSYIHQHLISDGMNKVSESGDESRGISAQNLLQDLKCDDDDDDQEISSCSKDSEHQSMECNDSVVQTEEELTSDSLLHQSLAEDISCIAMELPEKIDGIGKTNANQATEESHQLKQSKIGEANTEMLSIIEEISALIDRDQESYSNAEADSSCFKMAEVDKRDEIIEADATETDEPSSTTLMIEQDSKHGQDDDLLALGSTDDQGHEDKISGAVEMCVGKGINDSQVALTAAAVEVESLKTPKGEKQPETLEVIEDKIHAQVIGTGEAVDEREAENEVQIDATGSEIDSWSEQTSKLHECHATVDQDSNYVLLTTSDAGVLDAVELLKAPKTENQINEAVEVLEEKQAQDSTVTNATEEDVEEKETQHDVQTDAAGQVILDQVCNHEVFDADELLEGLKTEIQPETPEVIEDKIHAQIIETEEEVEERKAQNEVHIDTTGSEIDSGSEQTSKLNECQSTAYQDSEDAGILDAVESLKEPKTENQTNEVVEVIEEKKAQDRTLANVTEEDTEEKKTQHDVQTNAAGQVILDELDADDLLEATKTKIQPETLSEDEKDRHGIQINAAEDSIHAQIIGTDEAVEEGEGQDEVRIDATGLETDSGSEQTSELNECQAIIDQDSNHVLLTTSDAGVLNAVELLKASKTENQTNGTVEEIEQKKDQDCTLTNATEDVEEKETQHDVQTDAAGQVIVDQGCNHEEFDADELLKEPESKIQPETHTVEGKEAQYDVQINAVGEESEEKKDQHDAKVNAVEVIEENKAQDCTVTNAKEEEVEEKETEHDVQTDAAGQVILDQGCNHELLDIADAGAFGADELLQAPKTKIQPETHTVEGKETHYNFQINTAGGEENKDQHDAQTNEAVEVLEEKQAQGNTVNNATEEEVEEKETQHDVQTDAAGKVILDQGCNHEVFDADELLKAPKTIIQPENHSVEGKEAQYDVQINAVGEESEEKKDQHDAKMNAVEVIEEKKAQECTVTSATKEEVEEIGTQHDVQTDAAGQVILDQGRNHETFDADELLEALKSKIQPETHTVEGNEAQCDVHINAAGQESEEKKDQHDAKIDAAEIYSGSEQTSNLIELQKVLDQDYSCHISHQMTSENILPQENEQNMSQLNPVIGLNGEFEDGAIDLHSSKINTEFISIEPSAEEVQLVQSAVEEQIIHQETEKLLKEFHDISPTSSTVDTIIEDHLVKSITGEKTEGGSRAANVEKVEESSEGSVISLVESTSEPVLTAELVQEAPIQVTKEILIMDEKEKLLENEISVTQQKMEKEDGAKSHKIVNDEKEGSDMNLVKKYMLKHAEQNAEVKGILMRNRAPIVIGTMSALLCPLCHWYFGLPLEKICLIAVLVMVLSKIQGF